MFVHMLKNIEHNNHVLHNSLCESNSLIEKYKRKNRIFCGKFDHLKKRIQSSKRIKNDDDLPFKDQEFLSHAFFFVHTTLKVFNSCLFYLNCGCSRRMIGDKSLFKSFKEKVSEYVIFEDRSHA